MSQTWDENEISLSQPTHKSSCRREERETDIMMIVDRCRRSTYKTIIKFHNHRDINHIEEKKRSLSRRDIYLRNSAIFSPTWFSLQQCQESSSGRRWTVRERGARDLQSPSNSHVVVFAMPWHKSVIVECCVLDERAIQLMQFSAHSISTRVHAGRIMSIDACSSRRKCCWAWNQFNF